MPEANEIDLLIVDDDEDFRSATVRYFERVGILASDAASGEQAVEMTQRRDFRVAIVDMMMPGISGLDLLKHFKESDTDCEVILLTGEGTVASAVEAMKSGAFDYLTKPSPLKELEALVRRASEHGRLRRENRQLRAILERVQPMGDMIGRSAAMREVFRLIQRAGPSGKAILLQGESGTGKELVARALHNASKRSDKGLVVINCAALPESLLESELFGHEKGSFTGAVQAKPGLFEVADGGTLFIDEIGEMPGSLQAKMLRVLEDGSLRRVGSLKERRVNVRLLAATNRNLSDEVNQGRFREDLYYRINVMSLELPPLRQRQGDIPLLVAHFLGAGWEIDDEAMKLLERYDWPGNVRQLINAIERAKILADDNTVRVRDLPKEVVHSTADTAQPQPEETDELASIERAKVVEVLRRMSGNKTRAARALGIDRRKIYRLVEKYNIRDAELSEARDSQFAS
jgi:DNA-binding NtrC family response regulator